MSRVSTPDRVNPDGSKTITTKRACNGCGQLIGDMNHVEWAAAIAGRPLPDVRQECPACGPTAPLPACVPMQVWAGDAYCLELDCDHDRDSDDAYCGEVREETICGTHSTFTTDAEESMEYVSHSEPWPCQKQAVTQ